MKILISFAILLCVFSQTPASACTLKNAQSNFSSLNALFLRFNSEMERYTRRGETPPDDLKQRHQDLLAGAANIRKIFAREVEANPEMGQDSTINPEICNGYEALRLKHADAAPKSITVTATLPDPDAKKKEKEPVCTRADLRKRYGKAVRLQRKLTIAGKVNPKERVDYLGIATNFNDSAKDDFAEACRILHQYEKKLAAEKSDE